ncbi:unnamed protein product, partial [Gulo gulo]
MRAQGAGCRGQWGQWPRGRRRAGPHYPARHKERREDALTA